jgi:LEA14-like dessication related protein
MLPIPQLPKISFSDVSLSDVSWSGAKLKVDLDVSNPNIFGLDLNTLAYNLEAEGKSLGSGSLEGVTLEKGQTQTLSIPMDVSLTNLGISLFRMLSGGEAVDIGLSGKADVAPDIGVWKPEPMTFEAKRTLNQK